MTLVFSALSGTSDTICPPGYGIKERSAITNLFGFLKGRRERALLPLLLDDDEEVRRSTLETLDSLDKTWPNADAARALIPRLAAGSVGENRDMRQWAPALLARIDPKWKRSAGAPQAAQLLIALLHHQNEGTRERAAQLLGEIGDRVAVAPLERLLDDPQKFVRAEATRALAQLGDARVIGALLAHPNRYTFEALGQLDAHWAGLEAAKQAVPRLVAALKASDLDSEEQNSVASMLAEIGGPLASSGLLAGRRWVELDRVADARILGELATMAQRDSEFATQALGLLRRLLNADADVDADALVKMASLWYVSQERWRWVGPYESDEFYTTHRVSAGYDHLDATDVRNLACSMLVRKGRPDLAIQALLRGLPQSAEELDAIDPEWPRLEVARQALPRLLDAALAFGDQVAPDTARRVLYRIDPEAAHAFEDQVARDRARRVLDRIDPEWLAPVRADGVARAASDPEKPIPERVRALRLLSELDRDRALSVASTTVTDSSQRIQLAAAMVLKSAMEPRILEPLLAALRLADGGVVTLAAEALGQLGDPRAVPVLVEVLLDAGRKFRRDLDMKTLVVALGRLRDPGAVEALGMLVSKASGYTFTDEAAVAAVEALALIGGERATELLRAALGQGEAVIQQAAAEALGRLGDPGTVEALGEFLSTRYFGSASIRKTAVEALASIGGQRAVELLREALSHRGLGMEEAVAMALFRLRDPGAVEALGSVLLDFEHQTHEASVAAANALASIGGQRAVELLRAALGAARHAWGGKAQRPLHKLAKALKSAESKLSGA